MMLWTSRDGASGTDVAVNVLSRELLLRDFEARLSAGNGFALATLNLDHVVKLRREPAFRAAYQAHTHISADGHPIVWLSRLAGHEVELVTGSDLVDPLATVAARTSVAVAMVGSTEESLEAAARELAHRHPGFQTALKFAPPMGFDPEGPDADAIIAKIRASGARLCLVALGAPKQEIFAARALKSLPNVGFVSVGAGLDFLAGAQRRAPKIVQRLAAEWLWRLSKEPRRLSGRYAACAATLPGLTLTAIRLRRTPNGAGS
jgi:N-acetylglucosaminyldiphosphoundecaprenol N-acetyl-beta-D-mannosaminyltransferase